LVLLLHFAGFARAGQNGGKIKQDPKMWKQRKTMKTEIYLATGDDIAVSDFKR